MSRKADENYLKEVEKDRDIIRETQKRVSTSISFDRLRAIDTELYRTYKKMRSIVAGARDEDKRAEEIEASKRGLEDERN